MGSDLSLLPFAGAVQCQASKQTVQKAAAAVTSLPALLAANPAFALVGALLLPLGLVGLETLRVGHAAHNSTVWWGQHNSITSETLNTV